MNLPIYVGSVPTEHLDTFNEKLRSSLEKIVASGIDMPRMEMIISRDERQVRGPPVDRHILNLTEPLYTAT